MNSPILTASARFLMPLMLVFSFVLLTRGHNSPGGGFAGGLVAALTFVLHALAYGVPQARKTLRISPPWLFASGLFIAAASGVFGFMEGGWLDGVWPGVRLPGVGQLGSPLLLDVGVYLAVSSSILAIFLELAE